VQGWLDDVTYIVEIQDFGNWLNRGCKSTAETTLKARLRHWSQTEQIQGLFQFHRQTISTRLFARALQYRPPAYRLINAPESRQRVCLSTRPGELRITAKFPEGTVELPSSMM
jgi:hypothetical protein